MISKLVTFFFFKYVISMGVTSFSNITIFFANLLHKIFYMTLYCKHYKEKKIDTT
jgi:hypothetical protein